MKSMKLQKLLYILQLGTQDYLLLLFIVIIIIIIIIIKTLFTFELECKIYRNEMITAKDKKVTHASQLRASGLQARLWETSHPKNTKAPRRKRRKLTHRLLWI